MAFKELSFGTVFHSSIPQTARPGFSFTSWLRSLAQGWAAYRRYQMLNAMADWQLMSRGLERSDIARLAVFGEEEQRRRLSLPTTPAVRLACSGWGTACATPPFTGAIVVPLASSGRVDRSDRRNRTGSLTDSRAA